MFAPILLVALSFSIHEETIFMPVATLQIEALINKLGHNKWSEREKAETDLKKLGWKALRGCYEAKNHRDTEIRIRTTFIYNSYFLIKEDISSIWFLDDKLRYSNPFMLKLSNHGMMSSVCKYLGLDGDISAYYYRRAITDLGYYDASDGSWTVGWKHEIVATKATQLYIKDKLLRGETQKSVRTIIRKMNQNAKTKTNYLSSEELTWPSYDWGSYPTGPLMNKEDFQQPYGPPCYPNALDFLKAR